ncbi:hypothetical protein V8C86DRAFT_1693043 [Haematococcus lacustris]
MLLQWYNKKQLPPSVVMKKAEASKFKDTWEFQYGSDGLVYAHCKACPREDGDGRDVSNMSQTSRQHVCKSQSGGASNKRRVEENNYGPVLPSERGLPVPEALQRAVRRRFELFLTTSRTPFRAVDNEHLQAIFDMLGVDLHKETFYRTTQLEDLHREVKELTVKQLVRLLQDGFVICSDGWRYKFAGKGAPLVLFIKVVDVSGKRKDAVAIKDQHLEVLEELSKELELQGGGEMKCLGIIMDNTAANMKALRLIQEVMPTIIVIGCSAHKKPALQGPIQA